MKDRRRKKRATEPPTALENTRKQREKTLQMHKQHKSRVSAIIPWSQIATEVQTINLPPPCLKPALLSDLVNMLLL